eukprot:XP_001707353.1 Hypothetical protein GL50803_101129 [Giardia lamblia ATCC 50803]
MKVLGKNDVFCSQNREASNCAGLLLELGLEDPDCLADIIHLAGKPLKRCAEPRAVCCKKLVLAQGHFL